MTASTSAPLSRRQIAAALGLLFVGLLATLAWGWREYRLNTATGRLIAPQQSLPPAIASHLAGAYEVARRDPRSIAAVGPLCLAYHADMVFEPAAACYDLAMQLAPGDWRWGYYRALIDVERGGSPDLVRRLRDVAAANPSFGPAWLRIGDAEFKAGNHRAAADAWRQAQQMPDPPPSVGDPTHRVETPLAAHAALGLARVSLVGGQAADAARLLEPVVDSTPDFGAAWRLLGEAYRATGREADALRAVARAGRLAAFAPYADPLMDDLARLSRNATLLLRMASDAGLETNAGWSHYLTRRALEVDPDNPEAVQKMGRILRALGRNEEALVYFNRYRDLVPGDYQILAQIGTVLGVLGRYDQAESYFVGALKGVDDATTHFNHGLLLARMGRLDDAAAAYERALQRDPRLSDARTNLATLHARAGRLDKATAQLARVLADEPAHVLARTNMGLLLIQLGRVDDARRELTEVLRIAPGLQQAADALASLDDRR